MKMFKYLSSYFLLIVILYVSQCTAVDPKPPAPSTDPISVGTVLVYTCAFEYQEGTTEWHQTFQDRITTVMTPSLDSLNYTFHLGLEDFDNNTSADCILHGKTHTIWSNDNGIHTAGISSRDFPVIYYNNDKKVYFQCNENIAEKHTRYMVLIKKNDVKVINSSTNLGKADNGSIIACFYFKKIDKDLKVAREVMNKHKLVYKERQDPTTITSTTTAKPVTKPPVEVPTIAPTTSSRPPAPTTAATSPPTTAFTKSVKLQTTTPAATEFSNITESDNIQEGNGRTMVGCTVGVLMLILVIIVAVAVYKIYKRYKKTGEIGTTVSIIAASIQNRPLPNPPKKPVNAYSYIFPTNEYCQIIYKEPQVHIYKDPQVHIYKEPQVRIYNEPQVRIYNKPQSNKRRTMIYDNL